MRAQSESDGDPTHRDVETVRLQIGLERRPTRLHNFQPDAERLRKAHRHVDVDAFDLAGSVSEGERPVVLGQADAKSATSHDRVEAGRCLRVSGANEGEQEHVGEKARSKSDGALKRCKDRRNWRPTPAGTAEVAASGGESQLVTRAKDPLGVHSRHSNRDGRTKPSWMGRFSCVLISACGVAFWDYMRNRWERDGGLRLDHILLSSTLTERLQSAGVDRQTRGMADASDHAPVWVRLRDGPDRGGNLLREASGKTIAAGMTAVPKTERSTHRTGDGTGRKRRPAKIGQSALSGRPLLVIDGDSFAHRSYHALPKTIRRRDGKAAGAILGFANLLLRLHADQQPRAVIVGWDSLGAPTKRQEMFPAYQSGRDFDDDLIEQLKVLPELVAAFGFANAKAPGYEADDFLAAAVSAEERAGALHWWRVAIGIPFSSPRRAPRSCTRRGAGKSRASGRRRSGNDMALIQTRCRTLLRSAGTPLTNCRALPESGQNARPNWCNGTARLMESVPSRLVLELTGASSGDMRLSDHAARSMI